MSSGTALQSTAQRAISLLRGAFVDQQAALCGHYLNGPRGYAARFQTCTERGLRGEAGEKNPAIDHRITSSARSSSDCGIAIPSAFAALRLITNSNLVACSTAMSAGLAPLSTLSTNWAERRSWSSCDAP